MDVEALFPHASVDQLCHAMQEIIGRWPHPKKEETEQKHDQLAEDRGKQLAEAFSKRIVGDLKMKGTIWGQSSR